MTKAVKQRYKMGLIGFSAALCTTLVAFGLLAVWNFYGWNPVPLVLVGFIGAGTLISYGYYQIHK